MMKTFSVVVEKCSQTGLYVGYVQGLLGAHTQAEALDELKKNLCEVLSMLFEDDTLKEKLIFNFYLANRCVDD